MRNHLQRLTAQAAQKKPAVHPVVGAMFGSPSEDLSSGERLTEVNAEERSGTAPTLDPERASNRGALPATPSVATTRDAAATLPAPERAAPQQALSREKGDGQRDRGERFEEGREVLVSSQRHTAYDEDIAGQGTPDARFAAYEPLVRVNSELPFEPSQKELRSQPEGEDRSVESLGREESIGTDRSSALKQGMHGGAAQPIATGVQPDRAASRGSEEIQIHIGRIEVIATPSAVSRPAPPRRAESLSDYLQRHNGRSR